ncbi:hypothetical protein CEXT_131581 [Caerostris extrusa]|uniref:Uncharacterized protein n=1 Tax=Caerostris extrusa TaxID=172846 RepID=A0AAV4QPP2_CAEEX|nr:hypothetical protein CEXT_131581 [Caerostris extrusa]
MMAQTYKNGLSGSDTSYRKSLHSRVHSTGCHQHSEGLVGQLHLTFVARETVRVIGLLIVHDALVVRNGVLAAETPHPEVPHVATLAVHKVSVWYEAARSDGLLTINAPEAVDVKGLVLQEVEYQNCS